MSGMKLSCSGFGDMRHNISQPCTLRRGVWRSNYIIGLMIAVICAVLGFFCLSIKSVQAAPRHQKQLPACFQVITDTVNLQSNPDSWLLTYSLKVLTSTEVSKLSNAVPTWSQYPDYPPFILQRFAYEPSTQIAQYSFLLKKLLSEQQVNSGGLKLAVDTCATANLPLMSEDDISNDILNSLFKRVLILLVGAFYVFAVIDVTLSLWFYRHNFWNLRGLLANLVRMPWESDV